MKGRTRYTALLVLISFYSASILANSYQSLEQRLKWLLETPMFGFPKLEISEAPTLHRAKLGKLLFYDTRLSGNGNISCASCHRPEHAFSEPTAVSTGIGSQKGTRKAPPIINRAYFAEQFWDGRADSLESQAKGPIENPSEMGSSHQVVVNLLSQINGYRPLFKLAFGDEQVTIERVVKAIADFERTLLSGNSRWDRWKQDPNSVVYSEEEQLGFELFIDRKCDECHPPPFFTDNLFHNTGHGFSDNVFKDEGRYAFTKTLGIEKDSDLGAFKTPTLREVSRHAPYMHDGSLKTLEEVVEFYNKGGISNPQLSDKIIPLGLRPHQVKAMVAFMKSLDGTGFQDQPPLPGEFPF